MALSENNETYNSVKGTVKVEGTLADRETTLQAIVRVLVIIALLKWIFFAW